MSEILALGALGVGASIGLVSGLLISKHIGVSPHAKELERALESNKEYYKGMIQRYKGTLKEYEQPSDLQKMVQQIGGLSGKPEDLVKMLGSQLGGMRGLPRWLRPMIPGITSYISEHPDQVEGLIKQFAKGMPAGGESEGNGQESL